MDENAQGAGDGMPRGNGNIFGVGMQGRGLPDRYWGAVHWGLVSLHVPALGVCVSGRGHTYGGMIPA